MTASLPALSVVLPAYNEAAILADTVEHLVAGLREREGGELLVIENGSDDGTRAVAESLAERFPEVAVHSRADADYGAALRAGLLAATADIVVMFDADYYDLEFLDHALARLRAPGGPALIVGSKRAPGARDERGWARRLVTGVFSGLLRLGFGLRVSDTHGMKAMRRAPVTEIARNCRFGSDLFDTELILRVERAGLATGELPVEVRERRPPRTSIATRALRTAGGLGRLRVALWREARP